MSDTATLTEHETQQIERANATGLTPVVFIHGLWLLPSSWDNWATVFEESPTTAPPSSGSFRRSPPSSATPSAGCSHRSSPAGASRPCPSRWNPAPFRGVLPLPISALKSAFPVLGNPANISRAVPLTYDQFRYAFANAVSEDEAKQLFEEYAVPAAGKPLFQAAVANFNPWTEAKVDHDNPDRGPLLVISGELDHTVPWAIANASYKRQSDNPGVTEITEIKGRGHALTIDSGWREVADTALAFVKRFVS
jgi:non-heme chloroperoxidase